MKRNHMLMGLLVAAGVLGSSVGLAQSSSGGGSAGAGGYGAGAGDQPGSQRGGSQMGGPQTGGWEMGGSQRGSARGGAQMGDPSGPSAQPGERGGPSARDSRGMPPGMAPGGPGPSASPYAYAPGQWKKGDRLPTAYRDRQYVIDDWKSFQLERPPKGHQWVGIGNEFLLVSTRNGTIARVVTGQ
ncbi:RcnB family protein [Cupriavidus sp. H18C1]|uniref:RcnB family protein n=1 Tax=Cupriavidus sp. H18C1 TaxID=3241601 RepID=UPI003BB8DF85